MKIYIILTILILLICTPAHAGITFGSSSPVYSVDSLIKDTFEELSRLHKNLIVRYSDKESNLEVLLEYSDRIRKLTELAHKHNKSKHFIREVEDRVFNKLMVMQYHINKESKEGLIETYGILTEAMNEIRSEYYRVGASVYSGCVPVRKGIK